MSCHNLLALVRDSGGVNFRTSERTIDVNFDLSKFVAVPDAEINIPNYVVIQFYPWSKLYFPLFQAYYHTLPYPKTKENKIEPQHIYFASPETKNSNITILKLALAKHYS